MALLFRQFMNSTPLSIVSIVHLLELCKTTNTPLQLEFILLLTNDLPVSSSTPHMTAPSVTPSCIKRLFFYGSYFNVPNANVITNFKYSVLLFVSLAAVISRKNGSQEYSTYSDYFTVYCVVVHGDLSNIFGSYSCLSLVVLSLLLIN